MRNYNETKVQKMKKMNSSRGWDGSRGSWSKVATFGKGSFVQKMQKEQPHCTLKKGPSKNLRRPPTQWSSAYL